MKTNRSRTTVMALLMMILAWAVPADAYVGPGAGLSLLGALWGLLAAVLAAIGFILFWPIRRLWRGAGRAGGAQQPPTPPADQDAP